jgi:hypothetical protein
MHLLPPFDVLWARSFKTFLTKLFHKRSDETEMALEVWGESFARGPSCA